MDTTLRFKAMEKESLTSKFLFDRCCIFFILVQYNVGFRSMHEAFSQLTLDYF